MGNEIVHFPPQNTGMRLSNFPVTICHVQPVMAGQIYVRVLEKFMRGSIFDDTFIRYALSFEFIILTSKVTELFLLILRLGYLVKEQITILIGMNP